MVDILAKEVHKNYDKKRVIIALSTVIVILLLLWGHNKYVKYINNKLGDVDVNPQYVDYNIPGIDVPTIGDPAGLWDWMQSTDCACNCDDLNWQNPNQPVAQLPQYVYIAGPMLNAPPQLDFPVYNAGLYPTWWYEWGYNVHHEQAMYLYTSDGVNAITGKYSRSGWNDPENRGSYPQQTKNVTLQGDDAYINGRHYKHDPRRDKPRFVVPQVQSGTWYG